MKLRDSTKLRDRPEKVSKAERDLGGFELLKPLRELLLALRDESDPKRKLHYDDFVALLLLYFFNPTLTSLRGLQAASGFPSVRRKLGVPRASLGSLSAAQHVFDFNDLCEAFRQLLDSIPADKGNPRLAELKQIVTVADGTLLKALPRVAWALWLNDGQRAAKAHLQFEVLKGAPSRVDVTSANTSERDVFRASLESGRLYVLDSGYAAFALFQAVIDKGSSFVGRLPTGWNHEVLEERPLTEADREARVVRDVIVQLGSSKASSALKRPVRIVEIEKVDEPSKRMRAERAVRETLVLVTDRLDLSADLIAQIYSARWQIEIFFRWLKCTLGCKHLVAESANGVALQLYTALIACLLISLWTGKKPTKRVFEAICLYFQGWADLDDVMDTVRRLAPHANPA